MNETFVLVNCDSVRRVLAMVSPGSEGNVPQAGPALAVLLPVALGKVVCGSFSCITIIIAIYGAGEGTRALHG